MPTRFGGASRKRDPEGEARHARLRHARDGAGVCTGWHLRERKVPHRAGADARRRVPGSADRYGSLAPAVDHRRAGSALEHVGLVTLEGANTGRRERRGLRMGTRGPLRLGFVGAVLCLTLAAATPPQPPTSVDVA